MWAWDEQVRFLNDNGFRTLIYDKFGRGFSDRPAVIYDQAVYQRQLLELVDKLGITREFDLVGASLGAGTAVNFTAHYPHRVRKLAIISPIVNNYKVPAIFKIPIIGEFAARLIGINTLVDRFTALLEGHPDLEVYTSQYVQQTTYKGFQQSLLSMLRSDALGDYTRAYKVLGQHEREILLVWGTEDSEITREMISDILSYVPDLKFKPVENEGHGLALQKPEIINMLIHDFLQDKHSM